MAVTEALSVSPSVFGAGLAADDLILTLYFTTIYALAKSIPPEAAKQQPIEIPLSREAVVDPAIDNASWGGGHGGGPASSINVGE